MLCSATAFLVAGRINRKINGNRQVNGNNKTNSKPQDQRQRQDQDQQPLNGSDGSTARISG